MINLRYDIQFNYAGETYIPESDTIDQIGEGDYMGLVVTHRGKRFEAYYTDENVESDIWNTPYKLIKL